MSLIIDANCASAALSEPTHADFAPLMRALTEGRAKLVVGGRLRAEYAKLAPVLRAFRTLNQAGRAVSVPDVEVDNEENAVTANFKLKSDDPHILALARVTRSRLLCSRDRALHADFTNPAIINRPRGFVYQDSTHEPLIRKCCNALPPGIRRT